jgi:hypothetical protein
MWAASSQIERIAALFLALALIHAFAAPRVRKLEYRYPNHAGVFHVLSEIELVFAFWGMLLVAALFAVQGKTQALAYINARNYTEPLFVFAVMLVAASRPLMEWIERLLLQASKALPGPAMRNQLWLSLSLLPLLGSLLTEPAAMTIAALSLSQFFFHDQVRLRSRYVVLATLFVNISIGGVLSAYAAPPVLMVAQAWGWDSAYMFTHFGYKAIIAVVLNASLATYLVRLDVASAPAPAGAGSALPRVPWQVILVHALFLVGVVMFLHEPVIFMGLLLAFIAFTQAYARYQRPLIVREALMVACFLGGLVLLGGLQAWWLSPTLAAMSPTGVYFGAIGLTAITDNAALTYLASQAQGLSDEFKYFVLAGAVVGGGLTVIANAPNPAGVAILGRHFPDAEISPLQLLFAALAPTAIALICFKFL